MKKVSCKEFFTVMWSGICQVLGWFFGLFGYKRDGKFAKFVWGVFSISAAIIMAFIACAMISVFYDQYHHIFESEDINGENVSRTIEFVPDFGGNNGYLVNKATGKKVLRGIQWIATPNGKDSLVCFCNGDKRGYFNKKDGTVAIEPKYGHAWIFSDGIACVEEDGYIKFIDGTGKVVIDKRMPYIPYMEGYFFHEGYCVVVDEESGKHGLMDKTGKLVLPMEYRSIYLMNGLWTLSKGGEFEVLDKDLNVVLPMMECSISITDTTIDVTMPDHTMRKYDFQGTLINDFYVSYVRALEYDKDEILYRTRTYADDGEELAVPFEESYHPKATACLRVYMSGFFEGLMTADGHIVTMPLYRNIEAIGPDTYLCDVGNGDKVVVDGNGELVR